MNPDSANQLEIHRSNMRAGTTWVTRKTNKNTHGGPAALLPEGFPRRGAEAIRPLSYGAGVFRAEGSEQAFRGLRTCFLHERLEICKNQQEIV